MRIAAENLASNSASALKLDKHARHNNNKYAANSVRSSDKPSILYKNNYITKEEQERTGKKYLTHTRIIQNPDFSAVGGDPSGNSLDGMNQTLTENFSEQAKQQDLKSNGTNPAASSEGISKPAA